MQADAAPRGRIVTFYSYKGGTGRTMALANVACLLAEAGDEVLVVDWDLEAPGLHRFFPPRLRTAPQDNNLGLDDTPGLIDLFEAIEQRLPPSKPASDDEAEAAAEHALAGLDFETYVRDTNVPGVRIMRAGRNDDRGYSRRVGTFDWEGVFERAPGIYRDFAERLSARYRWVLVDSRTGVTDISGICTSLLPERLVMVFTPNRQSLTGVNALVERATEYRRSSDDLRPLLVYPLPSRIEFSLEKQKARWRFGDPDQDVIGYQPMFETLLAASYGLERCDLGPYFDEVQIQQTPDYAYGEEIAVRRPGDRLSMASSYVVFTNRLKTGEPPWTAAAVAPPAPASAPPPSIKKATPSASTAVPPPAFERPTPAPTPRPTPVPAPDGALQVFLSYVPADRDRVTSVASLLSKRGLQVFFERTPAPGSDYSSDVSRRLDASDAVVVFWSRASVESRWVMAEAEEGLRRGILLPVLLEDVSPPLAFRSVQSADLRRPTGDALERLVEDVRRVAAAGPGTTSAPAARSGWATRVALATAAVVVLAVGGWIGSSTLWKQASDSVLVPDFLGMTTGDVAKAAVDSQLSVTLTDPTGSPHSGFVDGVVTKQTPVAGTSVPRQTAVQLVVTTRTVAVPTLVGTTLDTALAALERSGLKLGKTTTQPVADAEPGTIVRQTPGAGTSAAADASVDVVVAARPASSRPPVSQRPESPAVQPPESPPVQQPAGRAATTALRPIVTIVPDLSGLTIERARLSLARARLTMGEVQTRYVQGVPPGLILQQQPAPGSTTRSGTRVDVFVAADPAAR